MWFREASQLAGGLRYLSFLPLGKWSNLTGIFFEMGRNHQLTRTHFFWYTHVFWYRFTHKLLGRHDPMLHLPFCRMCVLPVNIVNCQVQIPKVQRCMVLLPGSPNNKANMGRGKFPELSANAAGEEGSWFWCANSSGCPHCCYKYSLWYVICFLVCSLVFFPHVFFPTLLGSFLLTYDDWRFLFKWTYSSEIHCQEKGWMPYGRHVPPVPSQLFFMWFREPFIHSKNGFDLFWWIIMPLLNMHSIPNNTQTGHHWYGLWKNSSTWPLPKKNMSITLPKFNIAPEKLPSQ